MTEPTDTDWPALRAEVLDVFTPGPPINELQLFAGRREVIQRLQDIAIERGRHAIIFGERGVGKTSLASIFHKNLNIYDKALRATTRTVLEVHVNADTRDSFDSLWRKVFRRIIRPGDSASIDADYPGSIEPDHVLREIDRFRANELPIIIIDEYDRVEDEDCRVLMTDVIKGLTLAKTNPTIVLVGVADNIIQLVRDHASISRNLVQIPMSRMSPHEIKDIIATRVSRLQMHMSDEALTRITHFSSGLPFYAHSLGKYAALESISNKRRDITEDTVIAAIDNCMADVDYSVMAGYTRATEKIYSKDNLFRHVLAACALAKTNDLGQFRATAIEPALSEIMAQPFKVSRFGFHLQELCGPERGAVLTRTGARRTYLYHFSEAAMQPFVIMKSLKDKVLTKEMVDRFAIQRQRKTPG